MVGRRWPVISAGREQRRTDLHRPAIFLRDGKLLEQLIMLLLQDRSGVSRRARSDESAQLDNLPLKHPHDLPDGMASVRTWLFLPMPLLARSWKGYNFSHCHLQSNVGEECILEPLPLNHEFLTGSHKTALIQIKKNAPM